MKKKNSNLIFKETDQGKKVSFSDVIDNIWAFCFHVFTCGFITSSLYPGCALCLNYL